MYTIMLDKITPFYNPLDDTTPLFSPVITLEANKLATLTFTIYPDHPQYGNILLKRSRFWVYRDGVFMMTFRPVNVRRNMRNGLEYQCEEAFGVLSDYIYTVNAYGDNNPVAAIFNYIIATARVSLQYEQMAVGNISTALSGIALEEKFAVKEYKPIYDVLSGFISDHEEYHGYFVPRYSDATTPPTIYWDYLVENDLPLSQQSITFGRNLSDLLIDSELDDFFTVLIPLGADKKTSSADRAKGAANKEPLTIDEESRTITYHGITVGVSSYGLEDIEYSNIYGKIEKTASFPDVKTASALFDKGLEYLENNRGNIAQTVEIKAVDLRDAGVDVEHLRWMTRVPVYSPVHGIAREYLLTRFEIHLDNPLGNVITLGDTKKTLTDIAASNAAAAGQQIGSLDNRVFGLENG